MNQLTVVKMNQVVMNFRFFISAVSLFAATVILSSCEKYQIEMPVVDPDIIWHLSTDIQPIFTNNCISCHGGIRPPDLRDGKSYTSLTNGGYVNLPAESSNLYKKMTDGDHIPRSTDTEKQKVLLWIEQGAQNN